MNINRPDKTIRREKLEAEGKCVNCAKDNDSTSKSCTKCKELQKISSTKMINKRLEKGLCISCGEEPFREDKKTCESCSKRSSYYMQSKTDKGLCISCGKISDSDGKLCNNCRLENNKHCKEYRDNLKKQVFEAYGGKCECCGVADFTMLHIDHKNNDGNIKRKQGESQGVALYRELKRQNYPQGEFQLLCSNCNWSKYINKGICSHDLEKIENILKVQNNLDNYLMQGG